ncbi:MAG TPA: glycosyltransferase [Chloroflexota bacterium]|nr:glycosyltransferase [Chloroflexota bacterium]
MESEREPSDQVGIPATSLIICSRNRPQLLLESVESILQGDTVPSELIIVDQSSNPHRTLPTLTTDRPCAIRYLWTRSVGLCRANNAGIAAARHDILVFTHDDILADPAWFGTLVGALVAAGPRSVVTGKVPPTTPETPGGFAPTIKVDEAPAVYRGRVGKDVLFPLNMAMYRSAIAEVGPFDVRLGPGTPFPAAEDNDLGFRLLEAGYRIVYVPEAVLYHRAWRTERDALPLRWSYGRGQGAFYAKHLNLRDRYMLGRLRWDILRHVRRFARRWGRHPTQAGRDVVYMLGLIPAARIVAPIVPWWNRPRPECRDPLYVLGLLAGVAQWLLTERR